MKNNFYLIVLFVGCFSTSCLAQLESFSELNNRLSNEHSLTKLKAEWEQEKINYSKTHDSRLLYRCKLIESFVTGKENKTHQRLKALIWIEQNNTKEADLATIANYHITYLLLDAKVINLSHKYAFQTLSFSEKSGILKKETFGLIASIYFSDSNYQAARVYYNKELSICEKIDYLNTSSCNNNIGLSFMKEHQYKKGEYYFRNAFKIIQKIEHKSTGELYFMNIISGNIGSICYQQQKYDEAIVLLEKELLYYLSEKTSNTDLISPIKELLDIYTIKNNVQKQQWLLSIVDSLIIEEKKDPSAYPMYMKLAYDHALNKGNTGAISKLSPPLLVKTIEHNDFVNNQSKELINILYEDKLAHLNRENAIRKQLLKRAILSKKQTQWFFIIVVISGLLLIILLLLYYQNKRKILLKDTLIDNQHRKLIESENVILERENRINQEKITSLAMNLAVKKETEKVFLNKLSEIKRKKTIDTIEVIQELQLIVSNLLNIDEKMIQSTMEANQIDAAFKVELLKTHPELTPLDIQFCCYFRLRLSAKEIGSIYGMSDVSVRVRKNKIKQLMGLVTTDSLNSYLDKIPTKNNVR